jgi:predicted secreted hydrolase
MHTHYRSVALLLFLLPLLAACGSGEQPALRASIGAVEAVNADGGAGYARVAEPRPFVFPRDHGPHPEFQTEWWYYTGNLDAEDGRHFGFQLTFFRRSLTPTPAERPSSMAARNVYMAHFALSDVAGKQFYAFDRFSRDGGELAGASGEPFRVWLEDWYALGEGPEGMRMQLHAAQQDVAIDLMLDNTRPPALQGDRGLSQKGQAAGNASLYYSLTRMPTTGSVRVGEASYRVRGLAWMDREFGTSALEAGIVGWDWFSLQLDDGRDLMLYNLRREDGTPSPFSAGTLIERDGTTRRLALDEFRIETLDTWRSPHSQVTYPARWRLTLPALNIQLDLEPYLADQELALTVTYWEGAVRVNGTATGSGYVELTGYTEDRPPRY